MSKKDGLDAHAGAFFEMAQAYSIAADQLFEIIKLGKGLPLRDPTYFLYAHAVEIGLKALLLSHGLSIPTTGKEGHEIGDIFVRCRKEGLIGLNDPHFELHNLVVLLGQGNERQRYRYAGLQSRPLADITWVHDTVGRLMTTIEVHVSLWAKDNPPPPSSNRLTFGKPSDRPQPVPSNPGP